MSLQLAAQHIQQHGRNGDSMLVHMSPREVKSLNDLAMAHGGQLTINPHTGLPEAGFLSSILPMVAGVGLNMAFPGLGAMGSGLLVGGLTGVATGSLSKGLMAGLGAYGGAGLGESLAASGMQAAAAPELAAANSQLAALTPQQIAEYQAATGPVTSGPVFDAQQAAQQASQKVAQQQAAYGSSGMMDKLSTMGEGLKTLGTGEGWKNLASNAGGPMGLTKYGLTAAAPILDEMGRTDAPAPMQTDSDMGQRYTYSPNKVEGPYTASPTGIEQRYFNPQYQKVSNEQAKNIFGFADGGQVPAPGTPTQYSYDPLAQMFSKIDSMPSDDQTRQATEQKGQGGGKGSPTSAGYEAPSTQTTSDAVASGLSNYGTLGFMPGSSIAGFLGQAMIGSALANAAENGGYTGTFTGNAAFGNAVGNTASEGGSGPISGAAFNNSGGEGHGLGVNAGNNASSSSSGTSAAMGGGFGPGGGDARGGYLADGKFDQRPMAAGGISDAHYNLGGYSDGGRLLRGPGDGVSDSIPATIGHKQPARLADGEFVVPARIVSELGNGSTEAGARKLYAMMDRVQAARSKTVGKGKIAKNSKAEQYLPA